MTIYIGSRYATATVERATDSSGTVNSFVVSGPNPYQLIVTSRYEVRDGDRLDRLAGRLYGREDLWWVISDANPDILLQDPIKPGTILRIPDARHIR